MGLIVQNIFLGCLCEDVFLQIVADIEHWIVIHATVANGVRAAARLLIHGL